MGDGIMRKKRTGLFVSFGLGILGWNLLLLSQYLEDKGEFLEIPAAILVIFGAPGVLYIIFGCIWGLISGFHKG
jgi:hypothetical protein